MIRAFVLPAVLCSFALATMAMVAACASSHAAAPAARVVRSPAPEDPYADEGGPREHGAFHPDQVCGPNASCSFDCDQGGCVFLCVEGSSCNIQCDGGHCELACAPGATCNLQCDGGHCGTGCGQGASCNVQCDGGHCAQACAPEAACNVECDGGHCS